MDKSEKISWFEQFKIACLKPSQYKRLLNLAKGKVILFLAAITLITTILGYGMDVAGFTVSVGGWKNFILNRLPAFELKPGDYDFIVSVGGDGTLNEVTNGLILSESNIPMAIISAGTVNDFATYMKLPQTADGFCQMIKDFQTKKVDVGRVNNEYFINVLAAGMLTDIAYKVPKDKKAVLGKMAYYLEGVKEFPKQLSQNMTLTFNSKEYSGTEDIMLFLVANSKSVGGFADAAPLASVSDGYLDVMIIKKMALLTEAPDLIFKLFQGEHPKHPSIEYFQTKELSVLPTEQTAGIAIDYDGEILEEGLPVDISIVPEAINLIILRTTN